MIVDRRGLIVGAGALLAGCDRLNRSPPFRALLESAEPLTMATQRLAGDRQPLAREYSRAERSPIFRANGTRLPDSVDYRRHLASGFADWRLRLNGMVRRPLELPLAALAALPQRRQITRHDCVEGWSAIGEWQGPQLGLLLGLARVLPGARFAVFHCADAIGGVPYYETIDLDDAFHPQTILALRLNGRPLPVENGAPVRLRVERQLGYKHAKYVMRIELRSELDRLFGGKGGFWEDHSGYHWYAGI